MESDALPSSHRLREDVAERVIRRRLLRRFVPLAVTVPAVVIVVPLLMPAPDGGTTSMVPAVVTLAMTAIIGFIVYRRALARELVMWRSYRLALAPNIVRRVIDGMTPVEVLRSEVTRVVAVPGQGLLVHTADPLRFVYIPEQLERFEEISAELGQWAPTQAPDRKKARLGQALGGVLGLAIVGAWIASSYVSDPRVVTASLVVLYGGIGYIGWTTVRNPNMTMRQKASILMVFGLMALGPLARYALGHMASAP
jgi:hypothetical protein